MTSSVDLRGFNYSLQALMQRKQWQVDEGLRELATALQRVDEAGRDHEQLAASCQIHAEHARNAWRERTDPGSYQRLLAYLAWQQTKKLQMEERLRELRVAQQEAQRNYVGLRQALDGLHRHRKDRQDEYAAEQTARLQTQADQDWITRLPLRRTGANA
jgi:hypothetical protein